MPLQDDKFRPASVPRNDEAARAVVPPGAWFDLAVVLLLGFLLLSPILVSPHFGLFSDYVQILGWSDPNLNDPETFWRVFLPFADGRWTPMFHLLTFGLYKLVGPSAFAFYFVQGLTLLGSLALVYLLARWLSRGSRAAGWTASLLLLLSAPMAENYFTLDKVEPRLLFFCLLSFGYFVWRQARSRERAPLSWMEAGGVFGVHFLLAVLILFSKETGTFMVGVAALALAGTLLQKDRDARAVKEAALFFGALAAVLGLYVVLSSALIPQSARALRQENAGVGRYLNYGVTLGLALDNARGYWTWMRETALSLAVFGLWCVIGLWKPRRRDWDDRHLLIFLAGAGGCLYVAGMLLWRWMLLYYMLPAVGFLAVAAGAIAFDQRRRAKRAVPVAILIVLAVPMAARLPERWRTAWTILAQDRSKDAILRALEKHAGSNSKFVVAMFDVRSAEIGNSLERYLALDGYKGRAFVYNLVEGPWVNFADKHRYDGSAAQPPTDAEMDEALNLHSPFVIWRYHPLPGNPRIWYLEPLAPGDFIVIPVGSPSNAGVQARGISAFSSSRDAVVNTRFQGVQMKLLEEVHVKVPLEQEFLGWDLLEVTGIHAVSSNLAGLDQEVAGRDPAGLDESQTYLGAGWSQIDWTHTNERQGEPFRWGYSRARLLAPRDGGKVILDLEPNGQLAPLPIKIRALDHNGREVASWPLSGRMRVEFTPPDGETIHLRLADEIPVGPETICFRLFGVRTISNPKPAGKK